MIRAAVAGVGKMGISHCSILNAHRDVDLVAVCDTSRFVLNAGSKFTGFRTFTSFRKMLDQCQPDCVVIATPTRSHAEMVCAALDRGIAVYVEKPLSLEVAQGEKMVALAEQRGIVNQVGYHNRFLASFREAKRLLDRKVVGDVYHVLGTSYGPVVLRPKGRTWRAARSEGGGCLYDYASHVVNLIDFLVGPPSSVAGTVLKSVFSEQVDDAVYSTLLFSGGLSGQLSVNWSDEAYRKMSTQLGSSASRERSWSMPRSAESISVKTARKRGWSAAGTSDT
jgi:predicted dehydrogenase